MELAVSSWWLWMSEMFWQVGLLVVVLAAVELATRRWLWPQVRYGLWLLVLVKLVLPPTWTTPWAVFPVLLDGLGVSVAAPASPPGGHVPTARHSARVKTPAQPSENGPTSVAMGASLPGQAHIPIWQLALFLVWAGGMVVVGSVLLLRTTRLARWHRQQLQRPSIPPWFHQLLLDTSEKLRLDRVPAIVFSEDVVSPAVYGVFRPVLLLPAHTLDDLDREEAEHILLHELAHLKRGDLIMHAIALALQVVYWFNPFVAFAHRKIRSVREICCDLTVASHLREHTPTYRQTLVNTARHLLTERVEPAMGLLGVFEEPFKVVARIRWLDKPTWKQHRRMLLSAWLVVLLGVPILLPMVSSSEAAWATLPVEGAGPKVSPRDESRTTDVEASAGDASGVYIRNAFRIDTHIAGFRVDSQQREVGEAWITDGRIAIAERKRTAILDRRHRRFILVDHPTRSFVETTSPVVPQDVLSAKLLERWRDRRTTGNVEQLSESRRVLGRRCTAFRVTSWPTRGKGAAAPTSFKVWVTTDVPFDLTLLDEVLLNLRLFYNRDESYRAELQSMRGHQMRLEARSGNLLKQTRMVDEVVEMREADCPAEAFEPPAGYRRLERFDELDM